MENNINDLKSFTIEEVTKSTLEYFNGDKLATSVWINKYCLKDENKYYELNPDDMHKRIAKEIHRIECKYPNPISEEEIYESLRKFYRIVPQGSPMNGIGNNLQTVSLSNCFVIGNNGSNDSYGSILKTDQDQVQLMKRRGGVGHDLSHIRPKGSLVKNSALTSTGIVPFMERYSNTTNEVAQDGRRGALMLSISVKHPDSESFIDAKLEQNKISGANISVKITDDFMESRKTGGLFMQQYPVNSDNPTVKKEIDSNKLWNKIIYNAWKSAEPGILFWDTIINESIPDCYKDFGFATVSTNPSLRWNTKILTEDGIINIKEASENNDGRVIIKNIHGEWKEGLAFKSGINKQLYKIIFTNSSYEVYCTPEHKWPLINTNGQIVNKHTGKVVKKETKNLCRLDKIYFPQFENVLNVDQTLNENDGFISGWNLGDGWISYHKLHRSNLYGFIFSKEDCENNINNRVLKYINDLNNRVCEIRENKGCFEFCSSAKNVDDFFKNIGQTNKKDGLPTIVWKSNDNFIKGLIDGLFSSDGSVDDIRRIITFTTCHEKLAKDVHKLLGFYGIISYLTKGETKNPFDKTKKSIRYDIRITNKTIIKFNNVFKLSNTNKQKKIDNIINYNKYGKYSKNSKILSDREYLVIKNIELTDIYEDVYDITVYDDTHTFQTEVGITGNCGEIPLCVSDSCRLLAVNLFGYITDPFTEISDFNWDLFESDIILSMRYMDDIIDLEIEKIDKILEKIKNDPEDDFIKLYEKTLWEKIKEKTISGRRTGLGITSEGDMLAALGLRYGSNESIEFSEEVHKTMKLTAYRSSVQLAKERNPFPIYNSELEKDNPFIIRIKNENPHLYSEMTKYGRRNICLLTAAPTGSVSILTQTTSGIEPTFSPVYMRRKKINSQDKNMRVDFIDAEGVSWTEYPVFHHKFEMWLKIKKYDINEIKHMSKDEVNEIVKKSPYYLSTSNDIDWVKKVEMQGRIQKHIDHSISCTVNLKSDATEDLVSKVYETGWSSGCKGITVYRDGCRDGVLITESEKKENEKLNAFQDIQAPKRPKRLKAHIYRFQNNNEKWIAAVGLYDGRPYEIFTGKLTNGLSDMPPYIKDCEIVKNTLPDGKKRYDIEYIDNLGVKKSLLGLSHKFNPEYWNYAKLISGILRHAMPLVYVNELIESLNLNDESLNTWKNGVVRVIKKYIKDGVRGKGKCSSCGSEHLEYIEGCLTCKGCGISLCS